MTSQKRPYVPKTKGCFQCSRRRVSCDRAEPQCQKCVSRGLDCTGLGVRHRFETGIASRGKWVGKSDMQAIYEDEQDGVLVRRTQKRRLARKKASKSSTSADTPDESADESECVRGSSSAADVEALDPNTPLVSTSWSSDTGSEQVVEGPEMMPPVPTIADSFPLPASYTTTPQIGRLMPGNLPSWKTQMCLHFSRHISIEMVAVDTPFNAWRTLILPFAQTDELVMNAVLSVAVYHVKDGWFPDWIQFTPPTADLPDPNELHRRVIHGLRQQRDLAACEVSRRHSVLLTILVLLVGAMVTGRSDFPHLFRMLEAALMAVGGEAALGRGEVPAFVISQVNKLRVYSAPLLDENAGLQIISSPTHATELITSLGHRLSHYPEHAVVLSFVTDLVRQALDIYLEQFNRPLCDQIAPSHIDIANSITRVQHFKETLEAFPAGSPGEQVLVWASFVAASGCLLDEHMEFFEGVFLKHYARNGFGNVRRGLEYLRTIWAREPGRRWTSVLADAQFLIM